MSKSFSYRPALGLSALLISLTFSAPQAMAADSVTNVSIATGDSAKAVGQLALSGVKVVVGTVAAPFVILGAGAESTGRAVKDSGQAAWADANAPLRVSDETMVAQPAPSVPYDTKVTPQPAPQR